MSQASSVRFERVTKRFGEVVAVREEADAPALVYHDRTYHGLPG